MSKLNAQYLAGLIDGEGCIFVQKLTTGKRLIAGYYLRVSICMTDKPLIEMLCEQYDAFMLVHKKDLKNPRNRRAYEFLVTSNKAVDLLREVYEYLIVKKEQARLGIELQSHINRYKGQIPHLSMETIKQLEDYRELLRLKIKELKTARYDSSDRDVGEFGGRSMPGEEIHAEEQYRAKQEALPLGACNEQGPTSKEKICSDLAGDCESAAEMTAPHKNYFVV